MVSTHFQPCDDVVSRVVGDETVLVDLDGERYFSMNATGAKIWSSVTSGRTADEATADVVEQFDVGHDEAEIDVAELLARLVEAGLLIAVD